MTADDAASEKILFFVADKSRRTNGYTWRVWSGGTSFYIKPREVAVGGFKVSLHGPRTAGSSGLWKIAVDWNDRAAAEDAGGAVVHVGPEYRHGFAGRRVAPGVRHAVRIRNGWKSLIRGSASGAPPGEVKERDIPTSRHCVVPAPEQMCFADVDVFVSETGHPYWPDKQQLQRHNAMLGWLTNTAGEHLTAISYQHRLDMPSPPELAQLPRAEDPATATRGISGCVVDDVLWIEEHSTRAPIFDGTEPIEWTR